MKSSLIYEECVEWPAKTILSAADCQRQMMCRRKLLRAFESRASNFDSVHYCEPEIQSNE